MSDWRSRARPAGTGSAGGWRSRAKPAVPTRVVKLPTEATDYTEPAPPKDVTTPAQAAGRGYGSGLTSWLNEGTAGLGAGFDALYDLLHGRPDGTAAPSLGERYDENMRRGHETEAIAAREHPGEYAAGRVGGLATQQTALGLATGGKSLTPYGQGLLGAVEGAGANEQNRLAGAETGGALGLAIGGAFKAAPVLTGLGLGAYQLGTAAFGEDPLAGELTPAERLERAAGGVLSLGGAAAQKVSNVRNNKAAEFQKLADEGMSRALEKPTQRARSAEIAEKGTANSVKGLEERIPERIGRLEAAPVKTEAEIAALRAQKTATERKLGEKALNKANTGYHSRLDEVDKAAALVAKLAEAEKGLAASEKGLLGREYQRDYDAVASMFDSLTPAERTKLTPDTITRIERLKAKQADVLNRRMAEPEPEALAAEYTAKEKASLQAETKVAKEALDDALKGPAASKTKDRLVSKEDAARIARDEFALDPDALGDRFNPADRAARVPFQKGRAPQVDQDPKVVKLQSAIEKAEALLASQRARAADPKNAPSVRSLERSLALAKERLALAKEKATKARAEATPEAVLAKGNELLERAKQKSVSNTKDAAISAVPGSKFYAKRKQALSNPAAQAAFYAPLAAKLKTNRALAKYVPYVQAGNIEEIARAAAKDPAFREVLEAFLSDSKVVPHGG